MLLLVCGVPTVCGVPAVCDAVNAGGDTFVDGGIPTVCGAPLVGDCSCDGAPGLEEDNVDGLPDCVTCGVGVSPVVCGDPEFGLVGILGGVSAGDATFEDEVCVRPTWADGASDGILFGVEDAVPGGGWVCGGAPWVVLVCPCFGLTVRTGLPVDGTTFDGSDCICGALDGVVDCVGAFPCDVCCVPTFVPVGVLNAPELVGDSGLVFGSNDCSFCGCSLGFRTFTLP